MQSRNWFWLALAMGIFWFPCLSYSSQDSDFLTQIQEIVPALKGVRVRKSIAMQWAMAWKSANPSQRTALQRQGFGAILQTTRPLTSQERAQFTALGVTFTSFQGALASVGRFSSIRLHSPRALAALEAHPLVKQVDGSHTPWLLKSPLPYTGRLVQAFDVHARQTDNGIPIQGNGVTIGIWDSGIDVFHPSFFRNDGEAFPWIDVDKDGKFTPGIDAIDYNKNGKVDQNEVIQCLKVQMWNIFGPFDIETSPAPACRLGLDWLYLDLNGNGKRDFGPALGFQESDPGYGEPLFVADDANRNRKIDLDEKFVLLRTSKIRTVFLNGQTYTRGKNLIQTPVVPTLHGSGHGTMTAAVLLAGPSRDTWCRGIAPNAELVLYAGESNGAASWLKQQKAQVFLYEKGQYVGEFLDGSSNFEQMIDELGKQGMIQIAPTGNLGNAAKHFITTVPAGQTVRIPIEIGAPSGPNGLAFQRMFLSVLWRAAKTTKLQFKLFDDKGKEYLLKPDNVTGTQVTPTLSLLSIQEISPRDTGRMDILAVGIAESDQSPQPLARGTWQLEIQGDPKQQTTVHGYVADDLTDWDGGIFFGEKTSDETTATWPSTADTIISVGAVAGREQRPYAYSNERTGYLRQYSSQGPRIDGAQLPWLVAPDASVVAISPLLELGLRIEHGHYFVYNGTSSTGPQVAGGVALLKQLHPTWTQEEVKEALRKGAGVPSQAGNIPNPQWGYGGLLIYRTLFGHNPSDAFGCQCASYATSSTPPLEIWFGIAALAILFWRRKTQLR